MSIFVAPNDEQEWLNKNYVVISRRFDSQHKPTVVEFGDPNDLCLQPLKKWKTQLEESSGLCSMRKNHRGRCSTITFFCDVCGNFRRGSPFRSDEDIAACFMCCKGSYYDYDV